MKESSWGGATVIGFRFVSPPQDDSFMRIDDLSLSFRPATAEDVDFAWFLYRGLMKPLTEQVMTWHDINQRCVIERDIAGGDASIVLLGDIAAGWFSVREEPDAVRLCQLYVTPAMQNRGIGSTIVRHLVAEAHGRGKPVFLEVMKNNRARALYDRLGFTVTGHTKYKFEMACRPDG